MGRSPILLRKGKYRVTKTLIIVESPSKIKTLKKFLSSDYIFESSVGHIRDLPPKKFGIDIENDFEPEYEPLEGKKDVIDALKRSAKKADQVLLSTDPDREGEAIAWHIAALLPKSTKFKRVTFNAFTKETVKAAMAHPRDIDQNLVNAQQARRLLDRMVGYKISPILHRKIHRGSRDSSLSAGRVQSVALKLIVDREREIEAFKPVEYWNLGAVLSALKDAKSFEAALYSVNDLRVEKEKKTKKEVYLIDNEKKALDIEKKLKEATYKVSKVEKKEKKRNPVPPFITSTLQQEASRHYGFSASRTMMIAQSLYEGIDIGDSGTEGLITYMRTDSTRIAPEAQREARTHIELTYGKEFLPAKAPNYASKKSAQDAHEAIRPTDVEFAPDKLKKYLSVDQQKIYSLIWKRYMASQMVPAIYDTVTYDIETDKDMMLRATGSVIKFHGFLIAYEEKGDDQDEVAKPDGGMTLPVLKEGETLKLNDTYATQSFTKPPPRFTEASLVKELEKSGIGRPSTYASIMGKIQSRSYTTKERNTLIPTELGKIICQMLEENFPTIMDVTFTAEMEDELDKIAETDADWKGFLKKFWTEFFPTVELAEKEARVPKIPTDLDCPKCGSKLQKIWSKDRYFYGCMNYPDCDYTAPLEEVTIDKSEYAENFDWDQPCPTCGAEMKPRKSRYGIFLGCSKYPECKGIVNIPKKGEEIPENLPKCPAIGCDGQIVARKSRFGKTFFSCSTFPDCNVIANTVEELEVKYKDHPKTAYEGRKKKGAKKKTATKKKSTAKKKTATKKVAKKKTAAKTPRKQATYKASKVLTDIIGDTEVSRQGATKGLWDYIKKNKLQDEKNKRLITPDKKLEKFFGHKDPVDMMKLAGYISKHLEKP